MNCRHCQTPLTLPFLYLGSAPPSNAYLTAEALRTPGTWYPLRLMVCGNCRLVQTEDYAERGALFSDDYAYFSSYSSSWLAHAKKYAEDMTRRFGLNNESLVVEVAANDGYLLQYFREFNISCFGVEPTKSTAEAARRKGIEIIEEFFGVILAQNLAESGRQADLTVANNVLAHVPDINDFVAGFSCLLKPQGFATFEFPHLLRLVAENQFDTVYHEHYSYLSLTTVNRIFSNNGLIVFDVEELHTHGGSLRVFAQRLDAGKYEISPKVADMLDSEAAAGMLGDDFYAGFQEKAEIVKNDFLAFLLDAKRQGKRIAAYGAAAKGNTLLNFAGVKPDLIPFVCAAAPSKQGKFLPGSHIPILPPAAIADFRPDYVLILPWNIKLEVMEQLAYIKDWGGEFVTAIPFLQTY